MTTPPVSMPVVLLVEDNPLLLDVLLTILPRLAPFQFVGVADGITGLERCYELHPACIIIDIMMPGLNGYQLVRALRGDPETASIPLIILSALAREQEQFAGLAAGADQYLIKPVTVSRTHDRCCHEPRLRAASRLGRTAAAPIPTPKAVGTTLRAMLYAPLTSLWSRRSPLARY